VEGRRSAAFLAVVSFLVIATSDVAVAYERDVQAGTNEHGVEVVLTRSDGTGPLRLEARPDQPARPQLGRCDYHLIPFPFDPGTPKGGYAPSAQHFRFIVVCNGVYVGTTWIGPTSSRATAGEVNGRLIAERLVREIPIGPIAIGHRPDNRAITGIPAFFWVEGYNGDPIERFIMELGSAVYVRVSLGQAAWSFGDGGTSQDEDLGQAWPAHSSVSHVYTQSSPPTQPYAVRAELRLDAEYSVDGGAWRPLVPITRQAELLYDVNEVQAVRNR
jgi:hypothetical protein